MKKNPYLLAVALSVGLPVSIGSEELSSLELRAKKIREDQNVNMFTNMYVILIIQPRLDVSLHFS